MTDQRPGISVGVGAVVFRGDAVLLVKRGKPPFRGEWSIPGGRLEHGERLADAATREVKEETGVDITLIGLIDAFDALPRLTAADGPIGHWVLIDFAAEWAAGEPIAGDDAAAAEFAPIEEALARVRWGRTREAIARARDMRAAIPL